MSSRAGTQSKPLVKGTFRTSCRICGLLRDIKVRSPCSCCLRPLQRNPCSSANDSISKRFGPCKYIALDRLTYQSHTPHPPEIRTAVFADHSSVRNFFSHCPNNLQAFFNVQRTFSGFRVLSSARLVKVRDRVAGLFRLAAFNHDTSIPPPRRRA